MNVAYGSDPLQTMDILPAPGPGLHKLVLFVHGGGWTIGNKHGGHKLAKPLNQAGYTLATVNYRLVPQTSVAGCAGDIARSVAYLLDSAPRFGIDPSRFALIGHSSGGHLVALLGTDQHYLRDAGVDPDRLAAVIALDGLFDATITVSRQAGETRNAVFGGDAADWRHLSPISHIAAMQAFPAFGIMYQPTGGRFGEQAELFSETLRRHGRTVTVEVAPGLTHRELLALFDTDRPMAPFTLGCLAQNL